MSTQRVTVQAKEKAEEYESQSIVHEQPLEHFIHMCILHPWSQTNVGLNLTPSLNLKRDRGSKYTVGSETLETN